MKKGGNEFIKILNLGIEKHPNNIELHFWKRYFLYISYAKDFTEKQCLNLFNLYGSKNLILYFFLYQCNNIKYKKQKNELLNLYKEKKLQKICTLNHYYNQEWHSIPNLTQ